MVADIISHLTFCVHCSTLKATHRVKSRHSNLWSQYDLYVVVVGQHGALCKVKCWRFVALFE